MQNLGRSGQHQLYADTVVGKQLDPSSLFTNANDLYSAQLLASIYASQANPELQAQELIRLQQQAQRNALTSGNSPAANSRYQGLSPVVGGPPLGATPEDLYGGLHSSRNPLVGSGTFNLGTNYSTPLSAGPAGTRVGANLGNPAGDYDWSNPQNYWQDQGPLLNNAWADQGPLLNNAWADQGPLLNNAWADQGPPNPYQGNPAGGFDWSDPYSSGGMSDDELSLLYSYGGF